MICFKRLNRYRASGQTLNACRTLTHSLCSHGPKKLSLLGSNWPRTVRTTNDCRLLYFLNPAPSNSGPTREGQVCLPNQLDRALLLVSPPPASPGPMTSTEHYKAFPSACCLSFCSKFLRGSLCSLFLRSSLCSLFFLGFHRFESWWFKIFQSQAFLIAERTLNFRFRKIVYIL